ncbi:TerC family protein [Paenibacillus thermotolerans]|uniref:TerC family protein n=1 Tax=Paenibacillus thermotolerans TaxID=3027807 RepID=UPI002368E060|nr:MULTISPECIES: TerC family protein [unclassified Paenibacillus]
MVSLILIVKIVMINIVLSGDNAVVIAMASKNLPERQRILAVWWGAFGAVFLRIVLTAAAVYLLTIPYIQLAGSLLLLYIAVKLLADDESHNRVKSGATLAGAIWTVIVADFVMSLDNVLAIAAIAKGDIMLLAIGILISIPLIVWGSTFVMKLLHQYPVLVYIGAAILGYTAGEMLAADQHMARLLQPLPSFIHMLIPIIGAVFVVIAGLVKKGFRIRVI